MLHRNQQGVKRAPVAPHAVWVQNRPSQERFGRRECRFDGLAECETQRSARVVVKDHYLSDVIASVAVAALVTWAYSKTILARGQPVLARASCSAEVMAEPR